MKRKGKNMKKVKSLSRKVLSAILAAAMVVGLVPAMPAAEVQAANGA